MVQYFCTNPKQLFGTDMFTKVKVLQCPEGFYHFTFTGLLQRRRFGKKMLLCNRLHLSVLIALSGFISLIMFKAQDYY